MLAMWLARKHTRAALSEIGQYFGQRTHSTVISAQKKIDAWRSKGHQLDLAQRNWKLDDAIRRVEEKIRAG
jgi:chromosomal replication initiator protein